MRSPLDDSRPPTSADEGADWLYWDPSRKTWRRVELAVVPGERPRRVKVQHLDAELNGMTEWVPIGRLRVPWAQREAHLFQLDRWAAVESHAPETWMADIAFDVLTAYVPEQVATVQGSGAGGVLEVHELTRLCRASGVDAATITSHEDSVEVEGVWYAPWPVTELIVSELCSRDPEPAVRIISERARAQHDLASEAPGRDPWWLLPENQDDPLARLLNRWHERDIKQLGVVRGWADGDTPDLVASYLQLQEMYTDLVRAARLAVPRVRMVRSQKSERIASHLEELIERALPIVALRT